MTGGRFERQLPIPEIGVSGQTRLGASSVLVVGCGGLGSVLLYCLCGMGVGRVGFCDGDTVSEHNLNRQFLHTPADIGRSKVQSAFEKLSAFSPDLMLEPFDLYLTTENAAALISRYDLVVLAVDSIEARLVINRACAALQIPLIDGGVNALRGTLLTYRPGYTACLACYYKDAVSDCGPVPSFAPVVSAVASLEAQCAANILLDLPNPTDGRLLIFDGETMQTELISIGKNPRCPVCGSKHSY